MTAAEFLERFGHFVDAPDGIRRLRELILQLAVTGKLVAQDPVDEAASTLLRKCSADKDGLDVSDKKRPKQQLNVSSFVQLPSGWIRTCFGELVSMRLGKMLDKAKNTGTLRPYLRNTNVQWHRFDLADVKQLRLEDEELNEYRVLPGDLLICEGGEPGRCAVWRDSEREIYFQKALHRARPYDGILPEYLLLHLTADAQSGRLSRLFTGATIKHLTGKALRDHDVTLPPTSEQHRIVAKVDELMALCDRLEAERNLRNETHTRLIRAVHHPLTEASDAASTAAAWRRIRNNLAGIYTTRESVQALRQTILQLAVQGKLVPQDSNDEPATHQLARMRDEQKRLKVHKAVTSRTSMPAQAESRQLFAVPSEWLWARLGDAILHSEAGWSPKADGTPASGPQWGVLKVSAVSWGEYRPSENKALLPSTEPRPQYEVKPGDFLISRANTAELVARSVVVNSTPPRLMLSDKIIRLRLTSHVDPQYVNLFNSSEFARDYYKRVAGGTSSSMKNVSRQQIADLPLAFPPLAEQHRIVARVDELMALCDQLEAAITSRDETARRYAEAVVQQLSAA